MGGFVWNNGMQSLKTHDLLELSRPYLESEETVQVIWLDNEFVLLHFHSANSCKRFREAWEGRSRVREEERKKLLMSITVLPYEMYEEVCKCTGGKVTRVNGSKGIRDDDSCYQEAKRVRISAASQRGKGHCVFM